jgi:phosphoenolpyruvate synthase/pyruvate phosphate dikinase
LSQIRDMTTEELDELAKKLDATVKAYESMDSLNDEAKESLGKLKSKLEAVSAAREAKARAEALGGGSSFRGEV